MDVSYFLYKAHHLQIPLQIFVLVVEGKSPLEEERHQIKI